MVHTGRSVQILNLLLLIISFSIAQPPPPGKVCDNRYCIFSIQKNSTSFQQAQDLCFKNNTYLLELKDSQSKQVLEKFIANNPNLNEEKALLNLRVKAGPWSCIDKKNEKLEEFKGGEVGKSLDPAATYLALMKENGMYVAKAHSNLVLKSALCSIQTDSNRTCGERFKAYYNHYHDHTCYFSISGTFSWHQALNQCHLQNKASLITLHQASEMQYINENQAWKKKFDEVSYWIGCASELWLWNYSDVPVISSDWFQGAPSSKASLKCSYLQLNQFENKWLRDDCSNSYTVLCMEDKKHPTSISSSSLPIPNLFAFLIMILLSVVTNSIQSI